MRAALSLLLVLTVTGVAQDRPPDPRVGLKAGFLDAGVAVRHMQLVRSLQRREGFFDPALPAGAAMPPDAPAM